MMTGLPDCKETCIIPQLIQNFVSDECLLGFYINLLTTGFSHSHRLSTGAVWLQYSVGNGLNDLDF